MWWVLGGCLINWELYEQRKFELTDHDGDGFVWEDDCNDSDAAAFPGADEICDDADTDCDGVVDEEPVDGVEWFEDGDGDGFGAGEAELACEATGGRVANGLDCDDVATTTNPGAEDTPYNGVDEDCSGADLTDVDGDGFAAEAAGGSDCDDEDSVVNTAASDVPYDGVDQDCSGADDDDLDRDGWAGGAGSDCDDADATVHPDADETWADGFTDNDCDGDPGAATLEIGGDAWSGEVEEGNLGRRVVGLGDLDGDGLAEVAFGSEYDSTLGEGSGALYAVDGPAGGLVTAGRALFPGVAGEWFATGLAGGADLTGDGVPDLVVTALGNVDSRGMAWLVDGRLWADQGSTSVEVVAVSSMQSAVEGTFGPSAVAVVGDVDGDGVSDVALGECCGDVDGSTSRGRIVVFSANGFTGTMDDADVILFGAWDDEYFGGQLEGMGDQDGDGLDDLVVSGRDVAVVAPGNQSGSLTDVAITVVYGEVSGGFVRASSAGDLDGDGAADLAILGDDEASAVYLFTALGTSPGRSTSAPTTTLLWDEHGGAGGVVPVADRDGDGRGELFLTQYFSDDGTQRAWLVGGEAVTYGAEVALGSVPLQVVSVVPVAQFGYTAAAVGDVDGDGADDIALGAPDFSREAFKAGGGTILPIPR